MSILINGELYAADKAVVDLIDSLHSSLRTCETELDRLRAGIEQEAGFNDGMAAMATRPEWRDYHAVLAARLRALLKP